MRTDIAKALAGLRLLEQRAIVGAEAGLAGVAPGLAATLRATDVHNDETGATRAGYTAGVVGPGLNTLDPALSRAAAEVAARNPGRAQVASIGSVGAAEVVLIVTSPTNYQEYLSGNAGGARDALGPTLLSAAPSIATAIAAGIRKALS